MTDLEARILNLEDLVRRLLRQLETPAQEAGRAFQQQGGMGAGDGGGGAAAIFKAVGAIPRRVGTAYGVGEGRLQGDDGAHVVDDLDAPVLPIKNLTDRGLEDAALFSATPHEDGAYWITVPDSCSHLS